MSCRPAAVAGFFYPAQRRELARMVEEFLGRAPAPEQKLPPKALIVPHAGFVYSGPIAASAYATLREARARIRRVVLVGPAHRVYVRGMAGAGAEAFATPLGEVAVDVQAIASTREVLPWVIDDARAHEREHSLEVQLPFVQTLLPEARIVPLVVSDAPAERVGAVLEALWGGDETLIVVSSDLSHYLPYAAAKRVDEETASRIVGLSASIESERACGSAAVNGLLWVADRRKMTARALDLRSSGDTAGGRDEVVGYGAFAFYEPDERRSDERRDGGDAVG